MKLLITIGTRPEAIKMAPLILRLKKEKEVEVKVCNTGQHKELLDPILDFFQLPVDYSLESLVHGQGLQQLTGSILQKMQPVFDEFRPDMVLVHGDTTTSFAAALSAFYSGIKVGHVEAGLRTYQKYAPFPEEMNRHLTAVIADMHFAPTPLSANNLQSEGIIDNVFITGNTVIDALLDASLLIDQQAEEIKELKKCIDFSNKIILFTGHRRENFGQGFEEIFAALREITDKRKDITIVYPVHPNPLVKNVAEKYFAGSSQIKIVAPLNYGPFIWLMQQSAIILTDSGGIQEEAPSLGKPVLVLREVTERPEAVEAGTVILAGTDKSKIVGNTIRLLEDAAFYQQMSEINNPYGDGKACERIINHLKQFLIAN